MEGFHLFDEEHRSSYPLCVAYHAAKLSDPAKADEYLYMLRKATIVEKRQTTRIEELLDCARRVRIKPSDFMKHLEDGSAQKEFQKDLEHARSLNMRFLPAYLLKDDEHCIILKGLPAFEVFEQVIGMIVGA